ncbi:hypothetical protein DESC_720222 [Desulfosarcina cetonica]|nr:hypothetical protein DESC_720222 [Desulfosarcina cetonica]
MTYIHSPLFLHIGGFVVACTTYGRKKSCKISSDEIIDGLVKSRISDGFVKSPRSRLANPEE